MDSTCCTEVMLSLTSVESVTWEMLLSLINRWKKAATWSKLACVAGGSGCPRETFCGEAANSLAGLARGGIVASSEAARNSTRLLPILLATWAAFCTRVRDRSSRGYPLPPATQARSKPFYPAVVLPYRNYMGLCCCEGYISHPGSLVSLE